jgi:hypothetical protein
LTGHPATVEILTSIRSPAFFYCVQKPLFVPLMSVLEDLETMTYNSKSLCDFEANIFEISKCWHNLSGSVVSLKDEISKSGIIYLILSKFNVEINALW